MKRNVRILLITAILFCNCIVAKGQTKTEWVVSVGGSIPMGSFSSVEYDAVKGITDFGLIVDDTKGGAGTGFNVGIEMMYPLQVNNLKFTTSLDIHYNGLVQKAKQLMNDQCTYLLNLWNQEIIDAGETLLSSYYAVDKYAKYINIPLIIGLNYSLPLFSDMKIFTEVGVGMNLRFISAWKLSGRINYMFSDYSEDTWLQVKQKLSYNTVGSFAFKFGIGCNLTSRLTLSMWYYNFGKGDVSIKVLTENSAEYVKPTTTIHNTTLGSIIPSVCVLKLGICL